MSGANVARQCRRADQPKSALQRAPPISAAAGALLLVVHFLEASFDSAAVQRVPLPVEAGAQAFCLAVQLAATLTPLFAVSPRRAVARWRRCPGATIIAGQRAIHIADIADAAIHIGQRGALLAAVSPAADRDQIVSPQADAGTTLQIRALRQALRSRRLRPAQARKK